MARYKPYDYRQTKMLPVRFEEQILPGTFEYTLNRLIDESIDLTVFEARYRNTAICKDSRRCASAETRVIAGTVRCEPSA
jgi:hypothetical protein